MAGNRRSGRPGKSLEQHLLDGTYSRTRHAHLLEKPKLELPPKPKLIVRATKREQSRWIRCEADAQAFAKGCRFNEALAEHVCRFFRGFLRHSKGVWAGRPFEPTDWQITELLYPLFGWVREDGSRRFRRTYIEIPKKNMKSTTASGIGLYGLLEEPGAEVYSFGGNKEQARVVHNEAIHMVEASDALDANLNINRTTGVISYHEGKALYAAKAAGDNLHGINIHFAIADELHEWKGRKVWESLIYGSRARHQPLFFVITNAGDDKDSVCWEQRDKAQRILSGSVRDESFFALICAADESEARAELDAVAKGDMSIPLAKRVNPAMGTIIKEEDFLRDIQDALDTPTAIPNLLRLSYGVWVSAGQRRLLPPGRWVQLASQFSERDLIGRTCAAGIDLGFTHDLTALAFWFPPVSEGEKHKVLVYYWLPESVADDRKNRMRADFLEWSKDARARLELTPGSVTDHGYLQSKFRDLFSLFDVRVMLFDKRGAEKTTQEIAEGLVSHDGKVLLEGTGVPRFEFGQTVSNYAEPTKEFERLVVAGEVEHDGNPLLAWQVEHCEFVEDRDGNRKPVKPGESHDYRTVDGVQASVMALAGTRLEEFASLIHGRAGISVLSSEEEQEDEDEDY